MAEAVVSKKGAGSSTGINSTSTNTKAGSSTPKKTRSSSSAHKILAKDFLIGAVLGQGAFGKVLHVKQTSGSGAEYAMKIIEKSFVSKHKKIEVVMMERNVLKKLSHPNVVKLHFAFRNAKFLFFALDLCVNGTLLKVIVGWREKAKAAGGKDVACTLTTAHFYMEEVLAVLKYIHGQGIVHRDLKPENILIKHDNHLMLADFGTAKDEAKKELRVTFCGTAEYVSPEVLRDEEATPAADYWAAGCILFQLLVGQPPFKGINDHGTFQLITEHDPTNGVRKFPFPATVGPVARALVDGLLTQRAEKRLGSGQRIEALMAMMSRYAFLAICFCAKMKGTGGREASLRCPKLICEFLARDPSAAFQTVAPALPASVHALELPKITADSGSLADFELVLAQREMDAMMSSLSEPMDMEDAASDADADSPTPSKVSAAAVTVLDAWDAFLNPGEKVLLNGLVVKKRYRFTDISSKNRQLLLTDTPRLIYLDPEKNILKGEIPWSADLEVVLKPLDTEAGLFDVCTPDRTYYLRDMHGNATRWSDAIYQQLGRVPRSPTLHMTASRASWW